MEKALELTRKAATVFEERGFDNARLEAELLLSGVLGVKRLDLYLQPERPLTNAELEWFRAAVRRRLRREPLQYVLGTAAFRQLELAVDPRVLIPRPETEVLVGLVLEWARSRPAGTGGRVLDVGTGSGAIALSLAAEGAFDGVVATDISGDALDVARSNAERTGQVERVQFRQGDLLEAVGSDERFVAIVSNPPYVGDAERAGLQPEVRDFEPALALFAGPAGLDVVARLVTGAQPHLESGGLLAIEHGAGQGEAVLALIRGAGGYVEERIVSDLAGRQRFALAERAAY